MIYKNFLIKDNGDSYFFMKSKNTGYVFNAKNQLILINGKNLINRQEQLGINVSEYGNFPKNWKLLNFKDGVIYSNQNIDGEFDHLTFHTAKNGVRITNLHLKSKLKITIKHGSDCLNANPLVNIFRTFDGKTEWLSVLRNFNSDDREAFSKNMLDSTLNAILKESNLEPMTRNIENLRYLFILALAKIQSIENDKTIQLFQDYYIRTKYVGGSEEVKDLLIEDCNVFGDKENLILIGNRSYATNNNEAIIYGFY
jgi:hypothetical protein